MWKVIALEYVILDDVMEEFDLTKRRFKPCYAVISIHPPCHMKTLGHHHKGRNLGQNGGSTSTANSPTIKGNSCLSSPSRLHNEIYH